MDDKMTWERMKRAFGEGVQDYTRYENGFTLLVDTELNAYKLAYQYQPSRTRVFPATVSAGNWLVQVYHNEENK